MSCNVPKQAWPCIFLIYNLTFSICQVRQEVFQGAAPGQAAGKPAKTKVGSDSTSTFSGNSLAKSLHFDHDLDEPLAFVHKSSIAIAKSNLNQNRQQSGGSLNVAIQTEREVDIENNLGINVVSPGNKKFDLLSSDPLYFLPCDDHARLVSQKWYKNIKKLVRHLLEIIDKVEDYSSRKELISVRAIYVWICENIRYDPAFQEHQVDGHQHSPPPSSPPSTFCDIEPVFAENL